MPRPSLALAAIACLALPQCAAADLRPTSAGEIEVTRMVDGLDIPWAIAFLPDGRILVTERAGRLLLVGPDGAARPVEGVPRVSTRGQGGLLDVAVARDFAATGEIFLTFAEPRDGGAGTALAVARLDAEAAALGDVRVIFRQAGPTRAGQHFGSRVVEARDGSLFLTIGDRGERDLAQRLDTHNGTVVRVARDGTVPADNPFVGRIGTLPEIWSWGHRNPQGAALGLDGELWTVEHGPRGGDEANLTQAGRNYGWPVQSFGREYNRNRPVGRQDAVDGVTPPAWVWEVSPAVSGLAVYSGALFPEWRGDLLTGALQHDAIIRLAPGGNGLVEVERLFEGIYPRIRDVREAPDGAIWFLSEGDGAAYRIAPAD